MRRRPFLTPSSVIESPRVTTVPTTRPSAATLTPSTNHEHAFTVGKGFADDAIVKSPGAEMKLSCWASKWFVAGPLGPGTNTLTARSWSAGTAIATGSLSASAPGGITTPGAPANVSARSVPARAAAPDPARPIDALPTASACVPKLFVSRTRTRSPPTLVKTTSRTVWPLTPVADWQTRPGKGEAAPTTGLAPHVPIQLPPSRPNTLGRGDAAVAGRTVKAIALTATSTTAEPR